MRASRKVAIGAVSTLAAGACVVGLAALGGLAIWNAASNCPPPDFPRFADSQQTSFSLNYGSVTECDAEFSAPGDVADVTAYLRTQLDSGDWRLVGTDVTQGTLDFERRSKPSVNGQVHLLGQGDYSLVQVMVINH